ncbi:MAG TPA: hypothetical protein VMN60_13450 [Longimicrobiales bacterium]|nr:hypothetical protein [Longimicrobiales bacterium]
MHRRAHLLVGLVLLGTMGVSLAETIWAATCVPDMAVMSDAAMASMDDMDDMGGMDGMDGMPRDHDCMPGHPHDRSQGGDDGIPCPFAPAGAAQGCAASASLPGSGATVAQLTLSDVIILPSGESTPHLLQTASIFHPPKA